MHEVACHAGRRAQPANNPLDQSQAPQARAARAEGLSEVRAGGYAADTPLVVEMSGIEPPTSALRTQRSPS